MSYFDILTFGWFLNISIFLINFLFKARYMKLENMDILEEERVIVNELKNEVLIHYPNKKQEKILTCLIPFTAFFKTIYSFTDMIIFFLKEKNRSMYDFMVYKYFKEIERARINL